MAQTESERIELKLTPPPPSLPATLIGYQRTQRFVFGFERDSKFIPFLYSLLPTIVSTGLKANKGFSFVYLHNPVQAECYFCAECWRVEEYSWNSGNDVCQKTV